MRITTFSPCDAGRVDTRSIDRHASAAALRAQAIGDVHLRHDLDARDERDTDGLGQHHDFLQHPIYAVADGDPALPCLEMDVTRARRDSLGHDVIHELDHRLFGFLLIQLALRRVGFFDDWLQIGLTGAVEQLADTFDRCVNLLDALENAIGRGERHPNRASCRKGQSLLAVEVVGVGGGDVQNGIRDRERKNRESTCEPFRYHVPRQCADEQAVRDPNTRAH